MSGIFNENIWYVNQKLNPWNKEETDDLVPVSRLISLRDNDGALSKTPNKTIYMSMDFNKIDNYRFHDPLLYPISAVERSKHLYLPQINNLSMILPPAPPLTQFKDIPQVHTWIFNKSDLIHMFITLDYHKQFWKKKIVWIAICTKR